jgi:RNA polymerase sigma-70 factor (ECF subfamily)
VLALLARRFGDLDVADDAVQDALTVAAQRWPEDGIPSNPAAWLFTVARNRAVDRLRRDAVARRRVQEAAPDLVRITDASDHGRIGAELMSDEPGELAVTDDQLRLMLLCCHPSLAGDAQVALTLRLVGGLTTAEIAAGLLVEESTLAQRIVRAKRKIRDAGIPLRIPANLDERVDVVLGVLYLIFNEGYLSSSGGAAVRVDLMNEAIRLTRALSTVLDGHAEVQGLLALQLFHRARSTTRTDIDGDLILLEDQDRTRWDIQEIEEAEAVLLTAMHRMRPGPYQLQAVIARHHCVARTSADTDWPAIVSAYRQLVAMTDSPIVRLNLAVAVAMADGPHAGLAALDQVEGLDRYHLFHAAQAELLLRAGRAEDAASSFTTAIALTANAAGRRHLGRRLDHAQRLP